MARTAARFPARVLRYVSWRAGRALEPAAPVARRATAPLRLRPTFLVIGAQKAGTTSLYSYLSRHPAILCARPKEVHYFNVHYPLGDRWYLSHFPLATRGLVIRRRFGTPPAVGEVTPGYLFHPHAPERVHAVSPEMKLVAVLRDPVERAYSQYRMQVRGRGLEATGSFEDALERERLELPAELELLHEDPAYVSPTGLWRSYVARGRYADHLDEWLSWFPLEQLLVVTSEELRADPASAVATIADFLGVPPWPADTYRLRSVSEYEPLPDELRERLAAVFEPQSRRLEQLLGRKLPWTRPSVQAGYAATRPQLARAASISAEGSGRA